MNFRFILAALAILFMPALLPAQETFETCYMDLCKDGGLIPLQLGGTDKIEVRSKTDGHRFDIVSFTVVFTLGKSKIECTCRESTFTARCLTLRDKMAIGDEMVIKSVVFKDIRGGGEIRTAPELKITVVKPEEE